jgi:hypothetical protein
MVCYLQAALEINTEGIENSWGDTYDMYVYSAPFASPAAFKKETATVLIPDNSANAFSDIVIHAPFTGIPFNFSQKYLKIFLKFRALRI